MQILSIEVTYQVTHWLHVSNTFRNCPPTFCNLSPNTMCNLNIKSNMSPIKSESSSKQIKIRKSQARRHD